VCPGQQRRLQLQATHGACRFTRLDRGDIIGDPPFRLSIRTWRKLPRVCQRPLAQPVHEVQDHRVADRRAGGRKAAKLAPRPARKWCNNDQQLEPSCHHGHRRPGGSDSQPPGEGRPVFLPVTARARRSVRGKDSRNVPGVTSPFSHSAKRTVRWAGHQRWLCESVEMRREFKSSQPDNVRPGDPGRFVLMLLVGMLLHGICAT
jgi:hypothetical protein